MLFSPALPCVEVSIYHKTLFITILLLFVFFSAINGSEAGLVLSTLFMVTLVHFLALQSAETENNLISVERIMAYGQLQPEAPLESAEGELTNN